MGSATHPIFPFYYPPTYHPKQEAHVCISAHSQGSFGALSIP
uniref:Uncharacterized protein n=1 Tax=Arundo donax TaxID=35708 RepID=A0A0A9AKY8_ARUDO